MSEEFAGTGIIVEKNGTVTLSVNLKTPVEAGSAERVKAR